jgi:transcriptional antiterminator NusG
MKSNWYVINVVSGKDVKAKELLETELRNNNLDDFVNEIVIPIEKYKAIKGKKTVVKERNLLNGYMLINVKSMHPEIVQIVNNTNYIIGFLGQERGSRKNPAAITEREANRMLMRHNEEPVEIDFAEGDSVEIMEGAFKTFKGEISSIDKDKGKAIVDVKIFGRATKVEMNLTMFKKEY